MPLKEDTMRKKFSLIGFLLLALLNTGAGNVIAGSLCPRFTTNHACCHRHSGTQFGKQSAPSCHAHAHEIKRKQSLQATLFENVNASEDTECTHCLSHSQISTARSMATPGESSAHSGAQSGPTLHLFEDHFSFRHLLAFDHGPPGNIRSRHVLINVFRI